MDGDHPRRAPVGIQEPRKCDQMRTTQPISAMIVGLALAGCASNSGISSLYEQQSRQEQSLAASCTAWEKRAEKAAHPDAETVARHDQLMAKSAKYAAEAEAKYNNVAERQAAIENEVQAKMDADAVYDMRHDLKVAADCRRELDRVKEAHRKQTQDLAQLGAPQSAAQLASEQPMVQRSTLTQSPGPPQPSPVPNLGSVYMPPPSPLPSSPAMPGPYLGRVPGGPDVYGVPACATTGRC